jgi:tRNA-2-methylthio-N6-dimethylallyladenosine synthase
MEQVEKIIDERIQGKALVTENKKENTKKLFIGSSYTT